MRNSELAIVFPGQGSQSVAMLSELANNYGLVAQTFEQASTVLGYDLWKLVCEGPQAALNETDKTQPAMLAAGVAVWRVWQSLTACQPAYFAGHSLGEYTALVCSRAIAFEDAVRLVAERGRLMQQAVPAGHGAMAAILGMENETVEAICTAAAQDQVVAAVNYNAPGQVVIAGHREAVARAVADAGKAGARRTVTLPVSVPSHCSLMQAAAASLAEYLHNVAIRTPAVAVVNNVDVACETDSDRIREALIRQMSHPVRWVESIEFLRGQGITAIYEFGPGKVLSGLVKRIDRSLAVLPVYDRPSLDMAINRFK